MKWLIWSIEHSAWWKANHNGYTVKRKEAGQYSFESALKIVKSANIREPDVPNEAVVLVEDSDGGEEKIATCHGCKRTLPNDLINAFVTNDEVMDLCAVCALKERNKVLGVSEDVPFTGTMAKQFYDRTVEHYKKTNQL